MIKTVTRVMAAAAAFGLVAAPIVAEANTRAGDAGATYKVGSAGVGLGRADKGEAGAGAGGILIAILSVVAVVAGIAVAADSEGEPDPNATPG